MSTIAQIILFALIQTAQPHISITLYRDSLKTKTHLALRDSITNAFFIDYCCGSALASCLEKNPPCPIALRLDNFACWLILRNTPCDTILLQLGKSYASFFGPDTFRIAPSRLPPAGDSAAPVVITAYISASCNLCKKICLPLYRAVTQGTLAGKARLQLKPATLHTRDMALLAAEKQGKFWEFFLSLEDVKRRLDEKFLLEKAKKVGCNVDRFQKEMHNPKLEKILQENKHEALANGVEISPTLFINNRRYWRNKDPQWVIDAAQFEYEKRVTAENAEDAEKKR